MSVRPSGVDAPDSDGSPPNEPSRFAYPARTKYAAPLDAVGAALGELRQCRARDEYGAARVDRERREVEPAAPRAPPQDLRMVGERVVRTPATAAVDARHRRKPGRRADDDGERLFGVD